MSFADLKTAHTRLVILQLLAQDAGYDLNESILADLVREFGHSISGDALRVQLAWLEENGLVTTRTVAGQLMVAKLTARGGDAAAGRAVVPGVKRPEPEA
ncbi:MAG: VpaChn25_0724 family phage protein [Desulfobulbia bacterium]